MEANRIRSKVHRLPTGVTHESPSYVYIDRFNNDKLTYDSHQSKEHYDCTYFHLYFTTDEEIKEGDWYLDVLKTGLPTVRKCGNSLPFTAPKIIATTDPKLSDKCDGCKRAEGADANHIYTCSCGSNRVAQPSQAFIKAYCEQGGFDEVDVEYEEVCIDDKCDGSGKCGPCLITKQKLKVDPIHNTITTHRIVEKMYSREEMITNIHAFCVHNVIPEDNETFKSIADEWIKENL